MRKEDCYLLGKITRKHGLSGNIILKLDTDQPEFYKNLESIFVEINGLLVPFFIEKIIWPGCGACSCEVWWVEVDEGEGFVFVGGLGEVGLYVGGYVYLSSIGEGVLCFSAVHVDGVRVVFVNPAHFWPACHV